ncbi:MAG TPA: sterol desaturase family protein [Luteitalea sp.]|nr:sterol desaturase family protein [Luteitalea sp.]
MRTTLAAGLERITASRWNYRLGYLTEFLCPVAFGVIGLQRSPSWPAAVAAVVAGGLTFSFVEYAIHRWLFHVEASGMAHLHHAHHVEPEAPTALPCISSALVAVVVWPFARRLGEPGVVAFALCGFFAGYFLYSTVHYLEHHVRISRLPSRSLQRRWAAHAVHHRLPHLNFGVTTSLWDRVFGTYHAQGRRIHGE